jgi:CBS domain-containing protein
MKLEKVMKTDVECTATTDSVEVVARKMRDRNVGFLPVCDDAGAVVGTITDRDLTIRVLAAQRAPGATLVKDVMTPEVICVTEDDSVATVEELMATSHVSRIVVVDDDKCPIGVISLSDIAQEERGGKAANILKQVSEREVRT